MCDFTCRESNALFKPPNPAVCTWVPTSVNTAETDEYEGTAGDDKVYTVPFAPPYFGPPVNTADGQFDAIVKRLPSCKAPWTKSMLEASLKARTDSRPWVSNEVSEERVATTVTTVAKSPKMITTPVTSTKVKAHKARLAQLHFTAPSIPALKPDNDRKNLLLE